MPPPPAPPSSRASAPPPDPSSTRSERQHAGVARRWPATSALTRHGLRYPPPGRAAARRRTSSTLLHACVNTAPTPPHAPLGRLRAAARDPAAAPPSPETTRPPAKRAAAGEHATRELLPTEQIWGRRKKPRRRPPSDHRRPVARSGDGEEKACETGRRRDPEEEESSPQYYEFVPFLWLHNLDDSVKELLDLLRDSDGTAKWKSKAFFFGGLEASAVLTAVADLLKLTASDSSTRNHFGKIIHVDCSLWKSRRAMQRAIAEELNLRHLMPMFDKQDEEDDFRGVDDSSRAEIPSIGAVVHESLINERFLMIFHYGGDEVIDLALAECGVPGVGTYGKGKLLWTNHGRFQLSHREQKLMSSSVNIYMHIDLTDHAFVSQQLRHLLHKEAVEVIRYTGMDGIDPAEVVDCFLYSLFLTEKIRGKSISVDYGWATHACNYWICDGILREDRAWEVGSALHGVIPQLGYTSDETKLFTEYLDRPIKPYEGWNSITIEKLEAKNISTIPVNASSYFLTFGDGQLELRNDLFQLASNLRVLKLCKCSFNFSSPPFLCCQNLRFLWLDHCTNTGKEQGEGPCFPNLLVLDLRSTDYLLLPQMIELMTNLRELNTKGVSWRNISHAWSKLQNLHKLRVTESSEVITVGSCSSVDMINLELIDLSRNTCMKSLPEMSSARSLKMIVLDGCSSLEHVALERAPLLEIFSFDGYGPAEYWTHHIQLPEKELRPKSRASQTKAMVRKISLEGCDRLRSIFLRALPNLEELDLSGTAIKTLDLSDLSGAMEVSQLKKLFLLGCEQLRSLHWVGYNPKWEVLQVDTREEGRTERFLDNETCITFTDGRFIWSIMKIVGNVRKVHIHVSSMLHSHVSITKSIEVGPSQVDMVPTGALFPYKDIGLAEDVTCSALIWDCQQLHALDVHMEIGEGSHNLESMHDDEKFIEFLNWKVQSLHVHDSPSITAITPRVPIFWVYLEWCHVERCPKLHTLFTCYKEVWYHNFPDLKICSACDLLMAHCIWSKGICCRSFEELQHIYLHNCPRLVFVLPISFTLPSLETLQIEYCGNLKHVFPLDDKKNLEKIVPGVTFSKLKHIKLQHLHKLEQISEARLTAPALETISLRDCWGLRRLPAVERRDSKPDVDCEKDWWDRLEWDGLEANHDPSLYKTRHSGYYKTNIPRGSLLR